MKLKSIRISGFKSFADPVELSFHDGITGVVGPNGCGKSNIADALRWVLGNQNPRTLRAERMEDVIFAGSASRRPLGMAEVLITLDNSDRTIPVDFLEVSIARRLFRSGESEYLLNGSKCRLMDITDLLADCGLGSNGYWILEAEMVKAILSSRTEERRFLFDEAAGITRYKLQRHRAQLKLDATSGDLDRLEDIISEVGRNVEQLRKQASLLAKYEKATSGLHAMEAEAAGRIARGLRSELDAERGRLSDLTKREEDLTAASLAAAARLADARNALELAQAELDRRQSEVSALEKSLSDSDSVALVELERATAARSRSEELLSRAEELEKRSSELSAGASLASERLASISATLEKAGILSGEAAAAAEEAAKTLASAEKERDGSKDRARKARAALDEQRRILEKAAREREKAALERSSLTEESARLASERDSLAARIAELEAESTSASAELEKARLDSSALDSELASAAASLDECRAQLAGLVSREKDIRSQTASLEAEIAREAAGTLAADISMTEGYELAAGACLDAFGPARPAARPLPPDLEDGRYATGRGLSTDTPPSGMERLSDFLAGGPDEAFSLFSRVAVAQDRRSALAAHESGSDWTIVTREGDLFRPDGLVRLGVGSRDRGPQERRAVLASLRRSSSAIRKESGEAEARRDTLESARTDLSAKRTSLAEAMLTLQKRISSAGAESRTLAERVARLEARGTEVSASLAALGESSSDSPAAGGLEDLEKAEAEATRLADEAETLLLERSRAMATASSARDRAAHELEKAKMGAAAAREDMERDGRMSREQAAEAASLRSRALDSGREADSHSEAASSARKASESIRNELGKASVSRLESVSQRSTAMERSVSMQREADSARDSLDAARTARMECAALAASLEERLRPLEERMGQAAPSDPALSRLSDDELSARIARLSAEREKLGPVNMLARAEHEEANARLTFLETQKNDLVEARASIAEAIGEINRTAADRFDETFEQVRRNFSMIFQKFFEGGEAQLEALPGEDPLEGGVSIMARPRGKTLESISALSGGEKSMTAVALLFALYLVKPAPFCVLDELDAPLDDANVDRFIDLLDGFSEDTQFIVVTHNRRTMEAANRLYGVTMTEHGVSALASVSLEKASG